MGFNAKWVDTDFYVMGDGSEDVFREVSQLWAQPDLFMDAAALIAAFWDDAGKPKSLGVHGELPTGSAPVIYCDGDASVWLSNLGPGGPFTIVGTPLTNASTSPSD